MAIATSMLKSILVGKGIKLKEFTEKECLVRMMLTGK
jgi:hypothetical protein